MISFNQKKKDAGTPQICVPVGVISFLYNHLLSSDQLAKVENSVGLSEFKSIHKGLKMPNLFPQKSPPPSRLQGSPSQFLKLWLEDPHSWSERTSGNRSSPRFTQGERGVGQEVAQLRPSWWRKATSAGRGENAIKINKEIIKSPHLVLCKIQRWSRSHTQHWYNAWRVHGSAKPKQRPWT